MRPFIFLLTLLILFLNSQLFSKTWVDYPVVRDMSHMSEYEKAYEYLSDRSEVDLIIYPNSPLDLRPLVNTISIVHVEHGKVIANADRAGFEKFLEYGFDYEVKTPEFLSGPVPMSDYAEYFKGNRSPQDWYKYPTYQALVGFLEKWEQDFPEICKMYDLGPSGVSSKNHRIYALRISDNVEENEAEPRYLETNVIHGDEVLNMMNCLHIIDTILNSYTAGHPRFLKLVDSLEMWFIPNMNPDATYKSGDNTVQGAQRRNLADNFDLNRNNPCPCGGQECNGMTGLYTYYAKETEALMLLHSWYKFPFAQDQHGGTETYLWPYGGKYKRVCDEDWYKWLCKWLVGQIHEDCNNSGYMTSCGGDGVGHIYTELYECHGIRCDMNDYVGNGKSVTLESSVRKLLNESDLERHWRYCKEALFMSYELLYQFGLHGIVTDSGNGEPIFGVVISRDGGFDNEEVLTDSAGRYVKYMEKGNHTFHFEKEGYITKDIDLSITDYEKRYDLSVILWDGSTGSNNGSTSFMNNITITPFVKGIKIGNIHKNVTIGIYTISGKLVTMLPVSAASSITWNGMDSNGRATGNGCYIMTITNNDKKVSKSFILSR